MAGRNPITADFNLPALQPAQGNQPQLWVPSLPRRVSASGQLGGVLKDQIHRRTQATNSGEPASTNRGALFRRPAVEASLQPESPPEVTVQSARERVRHRSGAPNQQAAGSRDSSPSSLGSPLSPSRILRKDSVEAASPSRSSPSNARTQLPKVPLLDESRHKARSQSSRGADRGLPPPEGRLRRRASVAVRQQAVSSGGRKRLVRSLTAADASSNRGSKEASSSSSSDAEAPAAIPSLPGPVLPTRHVERLTGIPGTVVESLDQSDSDRQQLSGASSSASSAATRPAEDPVDADSRPLSFFPAQGINEGEGLARTPETLVCQAKTSLGRVSSNGSSFDLRSISQDEKEEQDSDAAQDEVPVVAKRSHRRHVTLPAEAMRPVKPDAFGQDESPRFRAMNRRRRASLPVQEAEHSPDRDQKLPSRRPSLAAQGSLSRGNSGSPQHERPELVLKMTRGEQALQAASKITEESFKNPILRFARRRSVTIHQLLNRADATHQELEKETQQVESVFAQMHQLEETAAEAEHRQAEDAAAEDQRTEGTTVAEGSSPGARLPSKTAAAEADEQAGEGGGDPKTRPSSEAPRHLQVSGVAYRQANGIYTLERNAKGAIHWRKYGSGFSLRWVDLRPRSDTPPAVPDSQHAGSMDSRSLAQQGQLDESNEGLQHWKEPEEKEQLGEPAEELPAEAAIEVHTQAGPASFASSGLNTPPPLFEEEEEEDEELVEDRAGTDEAAFKEEQGLDEKLTISPGSDMGTSDWYGWVLGLFDGDSISFVRSLEVGYDVPAGSPPISVHPGLVKVWESVGDNGWQVDNKVKFLQPTHSPEVVHVWHVAGALSGSYMAGGYIDGRTSYNREDAAMTIRWIAEGQRWQLAKAETEAVEDMVESTQFLVSAQVDSLDPTMFKTWHVWDKSARAYREFPGLVVNLGPMPPQQLYVGNCRCSSLDGVYTLLPHLTDGKPAYQKDTVMHKCAIRWYNRFSAWVIDERGLEDDGFGDARSRCSSSYVHKAILWEESAATADASASAGAALWAPAPSLSVSVVRAAPGHLYVEAGISSKIAGARGVYTLNSEMVNQRVSYSKATGSWQCFWDSRQAGWYLMAAGQSESQAHARILHDVPDPISDKIDHQGWQVWSPLVREWMKEDGLSITGFPAPPTKLHMSARKASRDHSLFGVYWLCGRHNGRPMWLKEAPAATSGEDEHQNKRGKIFWGGEEEFCWQVEAEPEAGKLYRAKLFDDMPLPCMLTIASWTLEEPSNQQGPPSEHTGRTTRRLGAGPVGTLGTPSGRRGSMGSGLLGPLGKMLGATNSREAGRLCGGLGPLGVPRGAHSLKPRGRSMSVPGVRLIDLVDDVQTEDDESDDDGSSVSDEEADASSLKFTCKSADDSPKALFLFGHGAELDCTLWLRDTSQDGRAQYENELGSTRLHWERFNQRWVLQVKRDDHWEDVLTNRSDCPDPSVAHSPWEYFTTSTRPASALSSTSATPMDADCAVGTGVLDTHGTFAINEEEEEEEANEEAVEQRASTKSEGQEERPRWVPAPAVRCIAVEQAPPKIFVTSPGGKADITGIFLLDPASKGDRRPSYIAERVGFATPCKIKYLSTEGRWVIERLPQLKGRHIRLKSKPDTNAFILAGAKYDAPNPVLIHSVWAVRQAEEWIADDRIQCRIVREPPKCICVFGETKKLDYLSGTYWLSQTGTEPPTYRMKGTELKLFYRKESKSWVISVAPTDLPDGLLSVDCNVPDPVETQDALWKARKHCPDETFACYPGEMPPKQVFFFGGRLGLAGVYSFMYRRLHNGRFAYQKEGTGWHAWWSSRIKRWVVGLLPRSKLDAKVEKGGAANFADAWCSEDVPHPAACSTWRFKARHWAPGSRTNTARGVITKPEASEALGERPFSCSAVADPPSTIVVSHADDRKDMAGVYFLSEDLHGKRCCYSKQYNSPSQEWAIFYNLATGRWLIHRHGKGGSGPANASVTCDSPDPTLAWSKWSVRRGDSLVQSKSLSVQEVGDVPQKLFFFGKAVKSEGQSISQDKVGNGVYVLKTDYLHCRRHCYVKETDSKWVIRFHAGTARWIVDGRGPEPGQDNPRDDALGSCSLLADVWHPAASDWCWSVWFDEKARSKAKKGKAAAKQLAKKQAEEQEDDLDEADTLPKLQRRQSRSSEANPSTGSIEDLSPRGSVTAGAGSGPPRRNSVTFEGRLTLSNINAVLGSSSKGRPSEKGDDRDSSKSGNSGTSKTSGRGKGLSSRSSAAGVSTSGRSVRTKFSVRSSTRSGRTRSVSGSSYRSGSSSRGCAVSSSGSSASENDEPKARQYNSWIDSNSIRVLPVGEDPDKIHVGNTIPAEVSGMYVKSGTWHGRPFYRLVDANGQPKLFLPELGEAPVDLGEGGTFTNDYKKRKGDVKRDRIGSSQSDPSRGDSADESSSSLPSSPRSSSPAGRVPAAASKAPPTRRKREAGAFDFSPFGYALRWHAPSCQWILGEHCATIEVEYTKLAPRLDMSLEGGSTEAVRLSSLRPKGLANTKGVTVGSELVQVDDDTELFRYQDATKLLQELETPVTLVFKGEGLSETTDGLLYLKEDSPFPHCVTSAWMAPFDGGLWFPVEDPVRAFKIECPPRKVEITGYRGKFKDLQATFELLPKLVNGKPAYQAGRWSIFWIPKKCRWTIARSDSTTIAAISENPIVLCWATCFAPHPMAVEDHGGRWQMKSKAKRMDSRQGVKVAAVSPSIELSEYEEIVVNSLQQTVDIASKAATVQATVVNGRTRLDPKKIDGVVSSLSTVLAEVDAFNMQSDHVKRAAEIQRRLAGWLTLETLLSQGEKVNASAASWMETLTELKGRLRRDRADPTVMYEDDGWTAMHIVGRYGFNEAWTYEAADALQRCGADLAVLDKRGISPTMLAILSRKHENLRALLRLVSTKALQLPLAVRERRQAESKFFQEAETGLSSSDLIPFITGDNKVDVNSRGPGLKTALHILALRNMAASVELLIREANADPELEDGAGDTAMHCAAKRNAQLTYQTLLRMGASTTQRNVSGRTAFMEAIEAGSTDLVIETGRRMVAWEDIEGVVGRHRHAWAQDWRSMVRSKVRELLRMGFGSDEVDPLVHPKQADKLQLANQVVFVDPGPGALRCCLFELRGALLCQEVLIPLLNLAGEGQLQEADGRVPYAAFLRYCLFCGLAVFGGVDVEMATMRGLKSLHAACMKTTEEVINDLRALTPKKEMMTGSAAGDEQRPPWPMLHQHFAHGRLPWLSPDGCTKDLLRVLGALVDEEEFESIPQLSGVVISEKVLPMSPSSAETTRSSKGSFTPFWDEVYGRWLVRCAKRSVPKFQAFCGRWGKTCRLGEVRSLEWVEERKAEHREGCWKCFPGEDEQLRQSVPALPTHVMEAGGITDILRCAITMADAEDLERTFRQMLSLRMAKDGAEVVFVRNMFWQEVDLSTDPVNDEEDRPSVELPHIRLVVMMDVPTEAQGGVWALFEVCLFLQQHEVLRQHLEILQEYDQGKYSDKNQAVRQALGQRTKNTVQRNGKRRPLPKFVARKVQFAVPNDAIGITELKTRDKVYGWYKRTQLETMKVLHLPTAAQVLTGDPVMPTALPEKAETPVLEQSRSGWQEIKAGGQVVDMTIHNFTEPWKESHGFISKAELVEHMSRERWLCLQEKDVDRLLVELAVNEVRLFFSPSGVLTKIRDTVVVHIKHPKGRQYLVRENEPCGFPSVSRRSNETILVAARRALTNQVPSFLANQLEVQNFDPDHGAWIEPELDEAEAKSNGTIPMWRRTFVVKVKFKKANEPFSLLRAGIGVDTNEEVVDTESDEDGAKGSVA